MRFLLSLIAVAYAICPYDLFPDFFIPGLGWIDDLIILGLLWWYLYIYKNPRSRFESYYSNKRRQSAAAAGVGKGSTEEKASATENNFREKEEQKDPHITLGVERNASKKDIKQAYKQLANKYHPDKVLHLGNEFKKLAEEHFKEIQEAYRELTSK